MHTAIVAATRLSDTDLLRRLADLAGRERHAAVDVVAHLAELQRRKLYREQGYGSLFEYCTEVLRLAEHAAFNRMTAARVSRMFPVVLDLLADGSINLSTLRLIAPHLTRENHVRLLGQIKGRRKRDVAALVAALAPQPDVAASVRKLPVRALVRTVSDVPPLVPVVAASAAAPAPQAGADPSAACVPQPVSAAHEPAVAAAPAVALAPPAPSPAPHRPLVAPLSPDRYRVQFTIGRETQEKLRHAQDLLRREIPNGDPGVIFDRALTLLLEDVARKKLAATDKPRTGRTTDPHSRRIPAAIKRTVWVRDHGRCAFVSSGGRRCGERTFLEFHHLEAYALGGETTAANLSLRCREHNVHESEMLFGPWVPGAVREAVVPYSSWSGAARGCHNELCATRPGASQRVRTKRATRQNLVWRERDR